MFFVHGAFIRTLGLVIFTTKTSQAISFKSQSSVINTLVVDPVIKEVYM